MTFGKGCGFVVYGLLVAVPAVWGQEPASVGKEKRDSRPAESRDVPKPALPDAVPTDAEKITRLQRSIEDSTRQVEELTAKLNDPASEFPQAESAFTELDRRLTELRKSLESLGEQDVVQKVALEAEVAELEPKHRLAKERFDLAIRERKVLQEQIATLQRKMQQDTDALKKLKGEVAATQPAVERTSRPRPVSADAANVPVAPPEPAAAESTAAPAAVAPLPTPPPASTGTTIIVPDTSNKPAPELIVARQEAVRKEAEAQSAQAEVASLEERINALQKNIELEKQLLETSRKKVENAQATERTLYETQQKKAQNGSTQSDLNALRDQIGASRDRLREAQTEARQRTDRLSEYQAELAALQGERIAVMEEAQRREAEAAGAQKRVEHLESPLSPGNLWRWLLQRGPKVGGIIIAVIGVLWMARLAEKRMVRLIAGRSSGSAPEDRENRAKTLVGVFHSAVAVVAYFGGGLMILTEVGVNIVPLMGGAAVLGLAVAFGAQNLIRDYFYGFTILLENQYGINDVVKVGDVSGQVERISLRCTVLRGLDGTVHFVPNGEIQRVSNMTHEWSRALFDIPVAYKEDVDQVMHELVELAKELRRDPDFRGLILEMPEMLGVDEFADSAVVIKFLIKTRPLKQWIVKRELLRRIKKRFDALGIEIPFPQRTVYHRHLDGDNPRDGHVLHGTARERSP